MKFLALILGIFLSVACYAQMGNYFLSHFSPDKKSDNICFDIEQDKRGVFYFATQEGVLEFDGRNWDLIKTNGAVYAIELADNGDLYTGGSRGFGKITNDENGLESFVPIYEKADAEYIFQVVTLNGTTYFLNEKDLFVYSTEEDSVMHVATSDSTGSFSSLNEIYGAAYISTEEGYLFKLEPGGLTKSTLELPDSTIILFSTQFEGNYVIGTSDNRIFVGSRSGKIAELPLEDASYASASEVISASWVNTELVGLGTLRGGIIFINPETGKTSEIINYNTGLPDNEVYTLISDLNQNVWAAHTYGFTRIAPYLPMRSFRYYPGLQGNLLCATTFNNNVYVGTSLGLFKLEKEEFYDEITYYVDVLVQPKPRKKASSKKSTQSPPPQVVNQEKTEKGGFFKFLRKKKPVTPPPAVTTPTTTKTTTKSSKPKPYYKKEERTKKILRSTFYGYKKVDGINAKVTQVIPWGNKLLAAGLEGAFEVNDLQSVAISEEPVRFLFASSNRRMLIASSYDDELHQLTEDGTGWKEQTSIRGINDPINYIFEEKDGAFWFCSFDKIYRAEFSDSTRITHTLDIDNPNFDKVAGISLNDQVIIATTSGFSFFNKEKQVLQKADTLIKLSAFFAYGSTIWFRDEHQWSVTGAKITQTNLQLLNLFNDIRFISTDASSGSVWIITGNNELFRFNSQKLRPIEVPYSIFLRSIGQSNIPPLRRSTLEIDQENSSLKIEVIKPDYLGADAVEYRYLLRGLNAEWSAWSNNNNVIDFPYLPPGTYTLLFESKDIFGKVSDMDPVTLEVLPPYWKRMWFYALEFGIFTSLVLLSFRLSHRYNLFSRLLSLLSIIILIEFIQTAAGSTFTTNSGPVIDFLIQVCVAFVILPIEGFLRKFMLKSIEKKYDTPK